MEIKKTALQDTDASEKEKKTRTRSPGYPTVSLREAVDRVRKLYDADGKAGAPVDVAVRHIGFATAHGQAHSVMSALKKFGLVVGGDGRIAPTQRAIEILKLSENDSRRIAALRAAALSPSIYRELVDRYKDSGLPSDEALAAELETYRGFNPNALSGFVKDFRDTLEFAGLSDLSGLEYGSGDNSTEQDLPNEHKSKATEEVKRESIMTEEKVKRSQIIYPPIENSYISTPVGNDEDGRPVFAQVRIDGPMKKEFIIGLKKYLEYLETTLQ
jgi:hypothetical protein